MPVDTGWAWLVMLGAFINTTCLMTIIRSISMLFVAFLDKYQVSATLTTLSFGLCALALAVSSMLQPAFFLKRFSERSLALAGSVINILATVGLAFSPNIAATNILLAVIGVGHGFVYVPQTHILGKYFRRRLALATSLVNLGQSLATIAGPPLVQMLVDSYGLEGGVLLLGGLNMHCLLGSMLLRPAEFYAARDAAEVPVVGRDGSCGESVVSHERDDADAELKDSHIKDIHSDDGPDKPLIWIENDQEGSSVKKFFSNSTSNVYRDCKLVVPKDLLSIKVDATKQYVSSSPALNTSASPPNTGFLERLSQSGSTRYLSESSMVIAINTWTSQTKVNRHSQLLRSEEESSDTSSTSSSSTSACCQPSTDNRAAANGSILTNPHAVILILASGLGVHAQAFYGYSPVLGEENGVSKSLQPFLLTIAGTCHLVSTVSIGLIADLPRVRTIYVAMVTQLVMGMTLQFVDLFLGLGWMVLLQVVGGCFTQTLYVLLAAITADVLGPRYIAHVMSGYFVVSGVMQSSDHVIVGVFKDVTHSFRPAFHYVGALYLVGFLLLSLEPCIAGRPRGEQQTESSRPKRENTM